MHWEKAKFFGWKEMEVSTEDTLFKISLNDLLVTIVSKSNLPVL